MQNLVLSSPRLRLRPLESQDENEIFALRSDERVNMYLDRKPAASLDDAKVFIAKIQGMMERNEGAYWAICLKENPRLIGTICYFNFSDAEKSAEIGYELHPFYQGKGIMQEALSLVVQFGFNVMELKTIFACPTKDNAKSIILLKKNGFKQSNDNEEDGLLKFVLKR